MARVWVLKIEKATCNIFPSQRGQSLLEALTPKLTGDLLNPCILFFASCLDIGYERKHRYDCWLCICELWCFWGEMDSKPFLSYLTETEKVLYLLLSLFGWDRGGSVSICFMSDWEKKGSVPLFYVWLRQRKRKICIHLFHIRLNNCTVLVQSPICRSSYP